MRSNLFHPWAWLVAAAVCYFTLPLVLAQAAIGPSIARPDAQTGHPRPTFFPRQMTPMDAIRETLAASLPSRAKITVLYGDPAKTGPFAVRYQFPAGYEVPVGLRRRTSS